MNAQFAAIANPSSDLRVLTDDELDNVNGGLWFLVAAAGFFALSYTIGYLIGSGMNRP